MAFTVETGTGVEDANAYVSEAFADTYCADRGFAAWAAASTVDKEAAIIRATDHIDGMYGGRFLGYKSTDAQGLKWPRSDAWSRNGYILLEVPKNLQKATVEYAVRALSYGVLTPDSPPTSPRQSFAVGEDASEYGQASGEVVLTREKVGPIETEIRTKGGTAGLLPTFPAADSLISALIEPKSITQRLIRG